MNTELIYNQILEKINRYAKDIGEGLLPTAGEIEALREQVADGQRFLSPVLAEELGEAIKGLEGSVLTFCSENLDALLDKVNLSAKPDYEGMQRLIQLLEVVAPDKAAKKSKEIEKARRRRDSQELVERCRRKLTEAERKDEALIQQARREVEEKGEVATRIQTKLPEVWQDYLEMIHNAMAKRDSILPGDREVIEELEREAKDRLEERNRLYNLPLTRDELREFETQLQDWRSSPEDERVLYFNKLGKQVFMPVGEAQESLMERWTAYSNEKALEYVRTADDHLKGSPPDPDAAAAKLNEVYSKDIQLDLLNDKARGELDRCRRDVDEEARRLGKLKQELANLKELRELDGWRQLQEIRKRFGRYWEGDQHPAVSEATRRVEERVLVKVRDVVETARRQLAEGRYGLARNNASKVITLCEDYPSEAQILGDWGERAQLIHHLSEHLPQRIERIRKQFGKVHIDDLKSMVEALWTEIREAGFQKMNSVSVLQADVKALEDTQSLIRHLNELEDDAPYGALHDETQRARERLEDVSAAQKADLEDAIRYVEALAQLVAGRNLPERDLRGRKECFERASQHLRCREAAKAELAEVEKQLKNDRRIRGSLPHLEKACADLERRTSALEETWQLYEKVVRWRGVPSTYLDGESRLIKLWERVMDACRKQIQAHLESWDPTALQEQAAIQTGHQWVQRFKELSGSDEVISQAEAILVQWEAQAWEAEALQRGGGRAWQQAAEKWRELDRIQPQGIKGIHPHPTERANAVQKQYLWEWVETYVLRHQSAEVVREAKSDIETFMGHLGSDPDLLMLVARLEDIKARRRVSTHSNITTFPYEAFVEATRKAEEAVRIARQWEGGRVPRYEQERWAAWGKTSDAKVSETYLVGSTRICDRVRQLEQQRRPILRNAEAAHGLKRISQLLTYNVIQWQRQTNTPFKVEFLWARGPVLVSMALNQAEHLTQDRDVADWIRPGWDTIRTGVINQLSDILGSEAIIEGA